MSPQDSAPDDPEDDAPGASVLEEELRSSFVQMVHHALGGERTSSYSDRDADSGFAVHASVEARDASKSAPTRIGSRFAVRRTIGSGGFGTVYLAHDESLDRDVAIKVPHEELVGDPLFSAQCLKEARLAAKLRHPSIVTIFDISEDEGRIAHIVQEYVHGATLYELIGKQRFSVKQTLLLVIKVAEAIAFAHARGVYHRDLKPANLIVDETGGIRVLDFGLAVDEEMQRGARGQVAGTIAYMSPEQIEGRTHHLDGRTDIWSLGVIFYELLTGRRPFRGSPNEISDQVIRREAAPPRQFMSSIPKRVEACCLKCLSKSVSARYGTAVDLLEDLKEIVETEPLPDETPSGPTTPVLPHDTKKLGRDTTKGVPQRQEWRSKQWWVAGALCAMGLLILSASAVALLPKNWISFVATPETDNESDINLLSAEPLRLVAPTNHSLVSFNKGELVLQSTYDSAVLFQDSVQRPDFDIHINMRQIPWNGVTGILFGVNRSKSQAGVWVAHLIEFSRDIDDQGLWRIGYAIVTIDDQQKTVNGSEWLTHGIEVKKILATNESIRIEVRKGKLDTVRIGGKSHREIAELSDAVNTKMRRVLNGHGLVSDSLDGRVGAKLCETTFVITRADVIYR